MTLNERIAMTIGQQVISLQQAAVQIEELQAALKAATEQKTKEPE